ncbi:MAG: tetratricopeptide repeat protein [Rhizobacter sp.]|nr:tetratricopeptide repeat protein [Chlorobiales bacterium]
MSVLSETMPSVAALEAALRITPDAPDNRERALLLCELAAMLRDSDARRALRLAEDAREIYARLSDRPGLAESAYLMGVCRRWLSDLAPSLTDLLEALRLFTEMQDDAGLCKTKNWIGNIYSELEHYDDALRLLGESRELAVKLGDKTAEAHALNNTGLVYEKKCDYITAVGFHLQAMSLREATGDRVSLGASYNNLGLLYEHLGDYPGALEFLFKAFTLHETFDNRRGKALVLNNLSIVYRKLGDESLALTCLLQSLWLSEQIGEKRNEINALCNIGNLHYRQGNYANALTYILRALSIARDIGSERSEGMALTNLGRIYHKLGEAETAVRHFTDGLRASQRTQDKGNEMESLLHLGSLSAESQKISDALTQLTASLELSAEAGDKEHQQRSHAALSEAHRQAGHLQKSAAHQTAALRLSGELHNEESGRKSRDLMLRHTLEQAERNAGLYGLRREDLSHITKTLMQSAVNVAPAPAKDTQPAHRSKSHTGSGDLPLSPKPAQIYVQTFGTFSVTIEGRTLSKDDWGRKKSRDVFKVLLINYQKAVTTGELIDAIWEEDAAGKNGGKNLEPALMNAVSSLRKALEPQLAAHKSSRFLKSQDKSYTLDLGEDAMIDFHLFKQCVREAETAPAEKKQTCYEQAVRLYTGSFLKEDLYESWATYERESLQESYLSALGALAAVHLARHETDEVLAYAEKVLACDRTSETAYDLIFTALHAAGRTAEMRKFYARCKQAFEKELQLPPPKKFDKFLL